MNSISSYLHTHTTGEISYCQRPNADDERERKELTRFLQTEQDLYGTDPTSDFSIVLDDDVRRILEQMTLNLFPIHLVLHDSINVRSIQPQHFQSPVIDLAPPIAHDDDYDLFPRRRTPRFRFRTRLEVLDVLDDGFERSSEKYFVFVVHCQDDR